MGVKLSLSIKAETKPLKSRVGIVVKEMRRGVLGGDRRIEERGRGDRRRRMDDAEFLLTTIKWMADGCHL